MRREDTLANRRIALIVDHPGRDLAGLVLLASELCRRGATCFLVPLNLQDREIWALAPDFVLLNYLRRGNDELARQLQGTGIRFGLLDTEGGVFPTPETYSSMFWTDGQLLKAARPVCMWGPRLADHLVQRGLVSREQVTVTGCPRFDYYHPRWRSVLSGNGGSVHDSAPCLLLNTRYGTVNSRFASEESNRDQLERVLGWPTADVDLLIETEHRAIAAMIDLAQHLAVDYPQTQVHLRPHPFEDPGIYRRGLAGLANATVGGDGPVQPAILRAAAVIQRGCTTAIEASLAGVPALSPLWIPIPHDHPMTEAVSVPCADYASLRRIVDRILAGQWEAPAEIRSAVEGVVGAWFYRVDGESFRRVADAIADALGQQGRVDVGACRRYAYGVTGHRPLKSRFGGAVRYLGRLSLDFSFQLGRVEPYREWLTTAKAFDVEDVRDVLSRLERASGPPAESTLDAWRARERRDYRVDYEGHTVTLAPVKERTSL